jgi:hypothetical protein
MLTLILILTIILILFLLTTAGAGVFGKGVTIVAVKAQFDRVGRCLAGVIDHMRGLARVTQDRIAARHAQPVMHQPRPRAQSPQWRGAHFVTRQVSDNAPGSVAELRPAIALSPNGQDLFVVWQEFCSGRDDTCGRIKLAHFDDAVNITLGLPFVRTSKGGMRRSTDFHAFWEAVLAGLLILSAVVLVATNVKEIREINIFAVVLVIQSLPFIAAVGLALIERTRLNEFVYWRTLEARVTELLPRPRRSAAISVTEATRAAPAPKPGELVQ